MQKNSTKIKTIGLLCSGGDAPGMNAAIRAVVRKAIGEKLKVIGVKRGYHGIFEENFINMDVASVGNIIQRGGTILHTSRCAHWFEKEKREIAYKILKKNKIDLLVIIGGNGSFNGAHLFNKETNFPIIGIPGTIDNDISGTEYTIGFNTAVQTAVDAVDKIRDTAAAHERTFVIEVMGRNSPLIALHVGICTGAETVVMPNSEVNYRDIANIIERGKKRGKHSSIIIVAEGKTKQEAHRLGEILEAEYHIPTRVSILGHIQRGGNPSNRDRQMASVMGHIAVEAIISGKFNMVTTYNKGKIGLTPLSKCLKERVHSFNDLNKLALELSI